MTDHEDFEEQAASEAFFAQFTGKAVNPFRCRGQDGLCPDDESEE